MSLIVVAAVAGWAMLGADDRMTTTGGATLAASNTPAGLVVTSLRTGGAEMRAGLRVGDVIDAVDGVPAPTARTLAGAEARDVAVLHVAARGDAGPRTLLLRAPGGARP